MFSSVDLVCILFLFNEIVFIRFYTCVYCMICLYHRVQGQLRLLEQLCEMTVPKAVLLTWIYIHLLHSGCLHYAFYTTVKHAREVVFFPPLKLLLTSI